MTDSRALSETNNGLWHRPNLKYADEWGGVAEANMRANTQLERNASISQQAQGVRMAQEVRL